MVNDYISTITSCFALQALTSLLMKSHVFRSRTEITSPYNSKFRFGKNGGHMVSGVKHVP